MSDGPSRRTYLDVLRGVAVLIMIEAHVLDSWTRFPDRQTRQFTDAIVVGGFGAPLFLFLAGVAVPLSAGSKFRRSGDVGAASRAVVRRGLEIFGLAFVFRVQSWLLGRYPAWFMFRVDILNIMGPSIMAAAAIWGALRTARGRFVAFVAATLAATLLAPFVRNASLLSSLPDPIEAYLRPLPGISNFVLLPWVGFLFAGVIVGLVLDSVRTREEEHAANLYFTLVGTAIALAAHVLSFFPTLVSAVVLLDDVAGVLLSPPRDHDRRHRPGVCLGAASWRAQMEPSPATGPDLALHLLDSCRDGLRRDFLAGSRASLVAAGVGGAGTLLPVHAAVLDPQGSSRGETEAAQGSGLKAQARAFDATTPRVCLSLEPEPEPTQFVVVHADAEW